MRGQFSTALVAPLAFTRYLELHIGLFGAVAIVLVVLARDRAWSAASSDRHGVGIDDPGRCAAGPRTRAHAGEVIAGEIDVSRNFYGS